MKLLIISEGYYPYTGGLEKIVTEVAEGLNEKYDHEVTVLTSTREKVKPYQDNVNGIEVHYVPLNTSHGKAEFIKELYFMRKTLKKMLQEHFDIISIQYMGYFSAIFSTIKTDIPYSISIHGTDVTGNQGVLIKKIQRRVVKRAEVVISNSYFLARELERKLLISLQDKLKVIWNGIDLINYKPVEKLTTEHTVVSVGRFVYKKGFDVLIEAFALVVDKYNDVKLLIAGDGEERVKCEELAEEYGIKNNIQFLGKIPNNKIGEVFEKGRIFVCPSRNESFGIVVLEAMAMGIPVIATNSGGVCEIIDDNKYGCIVPIENPTALANKMIELLGNEDECLELRGKGLKRVKEFSIQKVEEKYEQVFSRLLTRR